MIARKPVPVRSSTTPAKAEVPEKKELGIPASKEKSLESAAKDLSLDTKIIEPLVAPSDIASPPEASTSAISPTHVGDQKQPLTWPLSTPESRQKVSASLKSAYAEARHLAGHLVSHPHESTAHYSVLRHSTGIVLYKGSYTNLAITIFSDADLPVDRSLWLQRKGWMGKVGMKVGSLGGGGKTSWIDVTPTHAAGPGDVPPTDERAWQRDIKSFYKKAQGKERKHLARETCILRIPCEADDGYLRVVLCTGEGGKKILCPSPVFRLASTSTSMGSIKGAGLSSLPLELGLKVGGWVAKAHASSAVQSFTSPITGALQQYEPGFMEKEAMKLGYDATVAGRVDQMEEVHLQEREREYDFSDYQDELGNTVAGAEIESELENITPEAPFPIRFTAILKAKQTGSGDANVGAEYSVTGVSEDLLLKHEGRFSGWLQPSGSKEKTGGWLPALLVFHRERHKVTHRKIVDLLPLVVDSEDSVIKLEALKDGSKAEILLMAYLGPNGDESILSSPTSSVNSPTSPKTPATPQVELTAVELEEQRGTDIVTTLSLLALPAFAHEHATEQIQSRKSDRKLTEKFSDIRMSGQKRYDAIPAHRLGVRTEGQKLRDQLVGKGGLYIKR